MERKTFSAQDFPMHLIDSVAADHNGQAALGIGCELYQRFGNAWHLVGIRDDRTISYQAPFMDRPVEVEVREDGTYGVDDHGMIVQLAGGYTKEEPVEGARVVLPRECEAYRIGMGCNRLPPVLGEVVKSWSWRFYRNPAVRARLHSGSSLRAEWLELSRRGCEGHYGSHQQDDGDLGFFTTGPSNVTQLGLYKGYTDEEYYPVFEGGQGGRFRPDRLNWELNYIYLAGLAYRVPTVRYHGHGMVVNHIMQGVTAAYGRQAWESLAAHITADSDHWGHWHVSFSGHKGRAVINWGA